MDRLIISVVIPYKQRLRNLKTVLASLAEQTLPRSRFEVVVGAMEYATDYVEACREFADRLEIVTVMAGGEWNCSRARNMALRQAGGEIILFLDADMALPTQCLESLYDRYYADGQDACVLGQLVGYDNLSPRAGHADEDLPYSHYRELLAGLESTPGLRTDRRWLFEPLVLPWTIVWSGMVALRAATVRRHALWFDEDFRGWGGEDQEWGYRIAATGTPIVRGVDVLGLHLPHERDVASNMAAFDANKGYFLSKWPALDVELFRAFDGWEANRRHAELSREVAEALPTGGRLGVVRGAIEGADTLVIGARIEAAAETPAAEVQKLFDPGAPVRALPLVGLALPFPDGSVDSCRVLEPALGLSEPYRDAVLREAARVSRSGVATPA